MPVTFNVVISGVSTSGNLDTTHQALTIQPSNSDRIGYAHFMLENTQASYSKLTGVSGDATIYIDAIVNGVAITQFRGNVEQVIPMIDAKAGSQVEVHAYDYGQELLGVISPDARIPSLISGGVLSLLSGEQGLNAPNGMDLAIFVSGINFKSGATISSYMAQFFGRSGDSSGSFSGSLFSFKPHISGYTWKTWYYPDASGGVITNDNNINYWIPINTHKVKREYAWDALRRLTRQGLAVDSNQNRVALESYIGVSGDIHVFTSGSYEFIASGAQGMVTLQYYAAGNSGSALNNITKMKLPNDTTALKNEIVGWFPPQTTYPLDKDTFTDLIAYSGGNWAGVSENPASTVTVSGAAPGSQIGMMSIMGTANYGATPRVSGQFAIEFTMFGSQAINLNKWVTSGGAGLNLNYLYKWSGNQGIAGGLPAMRSVMITDSGGNFIIKSGATGGPVPIGSNALDASATGQWVGISDVIYKGASSLTNGVGSGLIGNVFNSGTGNDGGWAASATFPDLSTVTKIRIGLGYGLALPPANFSTSLWIDNLYFSFSYPFSPVVAFNSGSQGMYGRRYAVVEYPFQVDIVQASGLVTHDLNSRMGSKQVGEVTVVDNALGTPAQLNIKPGQVVLIDAPSMNTGSGQTFYTWRVIELTHEWSTKNGFLTNMRVVPWFSGTLVDPNSNLVDYQLPLAYQQPHPPPDRNLFMPGFPYGTIV